MHGPYRWEINYLSQKVRFVVQSLLIYEEGKNKKVASTAVVVV